MSARRSRQHLPRTKHEEHVQPSVKVHIVFSLKVVVHQHMLGPVCAVPKLLHQLPVFGEILRGQRLNLQGRVAPRGLLYWHVEEGTNSGVDTARKVKSTRVGTGCPSSSSSSSSSRAKQSGETEAVSSVAYAWNEPLGNEAD